MSSTLFYGSSDGNLSQRSCDATTFGSPLLVNSYQDPVWRCDDARRADHQRAGAVIGSARIALPTAT